MHPVDADPLEQYVAGCDAGAVPTMRALDAAVRGASPDLDVAIKYRILTYTLDRDWRHWVCALNTTKNAVCLRFLWGVLLDDPLGVLRPGTSTLMTWDVPRGSDVDPAAVGAYVADALATRYHYLASAPEVAAAARQRYGGS